MVRIVAYVGREPVSSGVVCDVVQTNVARGAFRAAAAAAAISISVRALGGCEKVRRRANIWRGKARAHASHGAGAAAMVPNAFEDARLCGV